LLLSTLIVAAKQGPIQDRRTWPQKNSRFRLEDRTPEEICAVSEFESSADLQVGKCGPEGQRYKLNKDTTDTGRPVQ